MTLKPVALTSKTCSVKNSGAPEIVILFGLARRTARKSRKYHYFTSSKLVADEAGVGGVEAVLCADELELGCAGEPAVLALTIARDVQEADQPLA